MRKGAECRLEGEKGVILYFYLEEGSKAKKNRFSAVKLPEYLTDLGETIVCFCPVPEYYVGKKGWKEEKLKELMRQKLLKAGEVSWYIQPELAGRLELCEKLPPLFLLQKVLRQNGCWENLVYIGNDEEPEDSFGEDHFRENGAELLFSLLQEYLKRINHFTVITSKPQEYEKFAEYIYEEYGIPTAYEQRLRKGMGGEKKTVVLDGCRGNKPCCSALPKNASYFDFWSEKEKQSNIEAMRRDVNYLGVVKFLDTIVKNGYNTIVNWTF